MWCGKSSGTGIQAWLGLSEVLHPWVCLWQQPHLVVRVTSNLSQNLPLGHPDKDPQDISLKPDPSLSPSC